MHSPSGHGDPVGTGAFHLLGGTRQAHFLFEVGQVPFEAEQVPDSLFIFCLGHLEGWT